MLLYLKFWQGFCHISVVKKSAVIGGFLFVKNTELIDKMVGLESAFCGILQLKNELIDKMVGLESAFCGILQLKN